MRRHCFIRSNSGLPGGSADTGRRKWRAARSHEFQFLLALALLAIVAPLSASAQTMVPPVPNTARSTALCPMIDAAARANALPVDFFIRVIWQESRFRSDAVGPLTSTGERAQGIAQFMPSTAADRGLLDPFNPVDALPKSGAYLAALRDEFGNLGLAAAAYNAGPQRVRDFLAGVANLPAETRNYVLAITGRPVGDWTMPAAQSASQPKRGTPLAVVGATGCPALMLALRKSASSHAARLRQRPVPSWCRWLHRPNMSTCGSVHLSAPARIFGRVNLRGRLGPVRISLR